MKNAKLQAFMQKNNAEILKLKKLLLAQCRYRLKYNVTKGNVGY